MPPPAFLDLPARAAKPRRAGIPLGQMADLLRASAAFVDVWKLGWGIAYLDPDLEAKLELLAAHRVLASPGGTLLEIAWAQGRLAEFLGWAQAAGFPCVEVSAGTVPMAPADKRAVIAEASERFIVLAEAGAKDPSARQAPRDWAREVAGDLAAGATWVIAEGRASGTVGIYDAAGAVREDVVSAIAEAAGPGACVFEAPREAQQAWFVRRFGPDVNLANIGPSAALGLETLRLGLRADTWRAGAPAPAGVLAR